jgi:hypothetical protein
MINDMNMIYKFTKKKIRKKTKSNSIGHRQPVIKMNNNIHTHHTNESSKNVPYESPN